MSKYNLKLKNINKDTPALVVKIGAGMVAVSLFLGGYAWVASYTAIKIAGIVIGSIGTFLVSFVGHSDSPKSTA